MLHERGNGPDHINEPVRIQPGQQPGDGNPSEQGGRPRPLPEDLRRGRTIASHKRGNPHYHRQGRGEEEQATPARRRSTQTPAPRRPAAAASQPAAAERTSDQSAKGSCIRCKATLDLDMTHAYCTRCFAQWRQKSDRSAPEKYCHMCGAEHAATMNRPLCTDCYPKYMAMPGLNRFAPRNANPANRSPRG